MEREIKEVICLVVPKAVDCSDETTPSSLRPFLDDLARQAVQGQYRGRRIQPDVRIEEIDWLVTNDVQAVQEFELSHDCDECRAGTAKTAAYLSANPERYVAVGNVTYTETWPQGAVVVVR